MKTPSKALALLLAASMPAMGAPPTDLRLGANERTACIRTESGETWILARRGVGFDEMAAASGADRRDLVAGYRQSRSYMVPAGASTSGPKVLAYQYNAGSGSSGASIFAAFLGILLSLIGALLGGQPASAATFPPSSTGPGTGSIAGYPNPKSPIGAGTSVGGILNPGQLGPFGPSWTQPGGAAPSGSSPAPTSKPPVTAGPGIQGASGFFQKFPLEADFRIPDDGVFGASRSGGSRPHHGNDLHAPEGTPIFAVGPGTVILSRVVKASGDGGYGNYIIIEHDEEAPGGGKYRTLYAHMQNPPRHQVGDRVNPGDNVGEVGLTPIGRFNNPHLHFEILVEDGSWKGRPTDPMSIPNYRATAEPART